MSPDVKGHGIDDGLELVVVTEVQDSGSRTRRTLLGYASNGPRLPAQLLGHPHLLPRLLDLTR